MQSIISNYSHERQNLFTTWTLAGGMRQKQSIPASQPSTGKSMQSQSHTAALYNNIIISLNETPCPSQRQQRRGRKEKKTRKK